MSLSVVPQTQNGVGSMVMVKRYVFTPISGTATLFQTTLPYSGLASRFSIFGDIKSPSQDPLFARSSCQ